jgi:hypothetical protein
MKMAFKKIFWGLFLSSLISCDKIQNPIIAGNKTSSLPTSLPTFIDSSSTTGPNGYLNYKILLEDVMGHFCPNCPAASAVADSIANTNSHVIVIEDHSGYDAEIEGLSGGPTGCTGLPSNAFSEDLRSVVGNSWLNGGSGSFCNLLSWPDGLIDRLYWSAAASYNVNISYSNWDYVIDSLIKANLHPPITINIHDSGWIIPSQGKKIIGVQITLNVPYALSNSGPYYLQTLIVEDSCIGWQEDAQPYVVSSSITDPPGCDSNYCHRNVLRGAFGNNTGGLTYGIPIPATVTRTSGATWTTWLTYDFINGENGKANNWNMAHCYIVAFISNAINYQILQAEKIKVE